MPAGEPPVLVFAPAGRDAQVAAAILAEVGLRFMICERLEALVAAMPQAACAVVTEEALLSSDRHTLAAWVAQQPPWSDFPFVLLTLRGETPNLRLPEMLGNVTVLERPFHPAVLANAVKSAARARARQREVERHQEYQALLIGELNHRVKNTLATVQSLAHQSFRRAVPPEEARERFEARLMSLSRTHNLLNETSWTGALLKQVLDLEIEPYAGESRRVAASGPNLHLQAPFAVAVGMVLHELATNAAKYGSLSVPEGRLEIEWTVTCERARPTILRLCWRERDGPPVAAPTRRGFGSRLIEQTVAQQLKGAVRFSFEPEGLVCELAMDLGELDQETAAAAE